jgi:hypothetical protein
MIFVPEVLITPISRASIAQLRRRLVLPMLKTKINPKNLQPLNLQSTVKLDIVVNIRKDIHYHPNCVLVALFHC